jgi:hypothetical protein
LIAWQGPQAAPLVESPARFLRGRQNETINSNPAPVVAGFRL